MTAGANVGSLGKGIGLLALWHIGIFLLLGTLAIAVPREGHFDLFPQGQVPLIFWSFGITFTQLIYVVPLGIHFSGRGEARTTKGIWLGALVTALVHGSCWAIALSGFRP